MAPQRYSVIERIKAAVRERDGFCCVLCGRTNFECKQLWNRSLEVHRVVPRSLYSIEPGVCQSLCRTCHARQKASPHSRTVRVPGGGRRVIFINGFTYG